VLLLFAYAEKTQGVLCRIWDLGQIQVTFKNVVDVFVETTGVFA
jgi:hypothetical protein